MEERINVLIGKEQLSEKIREIAEQINRDYVEKEIFLLCILKGSVYFTCELSKYLEMPVKLGFMSVTSYGDNLTSSGAVTVNGSLDLDIEGKHVLVVEDIIDTGKTLSFLLHMLAKKNPASLKLCTLLDKPESRVSEVKVDYSGFEISDKFVVGFGMDYAQKYRNLPYIGELVFKEDKK